METAIATETLRALRRILRASELSSRKLAAATGLAPSQLLVLQEVGRRGEATPTGIASALNFGQATITNIVDRLVAAGYLSRTRADFDRRRMLLHVTDAGKATLENAPDLLQNRFRDDFGSLPAWEQAMILAALERLAEVLGADDIDAAPLIDAGTIQPPDR
ncbi:MarR family transcriptional regulator [Croceicoccus estronivorus]|uniref:MarR family winged helix-turn-helix transcriptional regulator n=1 Tax=Croceicoccus estronivorus TaxID=1172626 RepID=UPI0008367308|nr:MarR family transcriptional regulator [Croceicoccus estronivorus]OCC22462.1 MarR family transcriptional regulator [Croceicoccus estronivorus]